MDLLRSISVVGTAGGSDLNLRRSLLRVDASRPVSSALARQEELEPRDRTSRLDNRLRDCVRIDPQRTPLGHAPRHGKGSDRISTWESLSRGENPGQAGDDGSVWMSVEYAGDLSIEVGELAVELELRPCKPGVGAEDSSPWW